MLYHSHNLKLYLIFILMKILSFNKVSLWKWFILARSWFIFPVNGHVFYEFVGIHIKAESCCRKVEPSFTSFSAKFNGKDCCEIKQPLTPSLPLSHLQPDIYGILESLLSWCTLQNDPICLDTSVRASLWSFKIFVKSNLPGLMFSTSKMHKHRWMAEHKAAVDAFFIVRFGGSKSKRVDEKKSV